MTAITVRLDNMAHGGEVMGRHEGQPILVPLGIPGELVRVVVDEKRRRFWRGHITEVLEPSPERVRPPCRYFGLCGGCQWQHIDYAAQLQWKQRLVAQQLRRLGGQGEVPVGEVLGMAEPWAYRNHTQFVADEEGRLGFRALRSHDVVTVEECWITHPMIDDLWGALDIEGWRAERVVLRAGVETGEGLVVLEGDDNPPEVVIDAPVSCLYQTRGGRVEVLAGSGHYHERLAGRTLRVSAPSFFQVNTAQAERLVEVVRAYLALAAGETLLDAYCGVGTFALTIGQDAGRVVAIEEAPSAVADLRANVTPDDMVTVIEGRAEAVLPGLGLRADAVVVDPPRGGCAPAVLQAIAATGAGRIAYVSCDAATLARDVARLGELGYVLRAVQPVDMFPQTSHVECVVLMSRVGK
jgi:23S rRNA (uracil1939-C5)-methyltransferase